MKTIKVISDKGWRDCPAFKIDGCNGLAVTMSQFGLFEVTHVETGKRLLGQYERSANAMCEMVQLSLAFREAEINPLDNAELFRRKIRESQVKCKNLGDLSIIDYLRVVSPVLNFSGEFPWEDEDTNPHIRLKGLMEELKKVA